MLHCVHELGCLLHLLVLGTVLLLELLLLLETKSMSAVKVSENSKVLIAAFKVKTIG